MVRSLSTLCIVSLRDGLKQQRLPVHLIPHESQRRQLLEMVLMKSGIIEETACISLSSPEFLDGFTSIDTQSGTVDDYRFLECVADTLTTSKGDETIGGGVSELKLNIYGIWNRDCYMESNLGGVIHLISQCPNLKSLHLNMVRINGPVADDYWKHSTEEDRCRLAPMNLFNFRTSSGGLLNNVVQLHPCVSILENLESLTLIGADCDRVAAPFLQSGAPVIDFRRLSKLRLANSQVDGEKWRELLRLIKDTQIDLDVKYMTCMPGSGIVDLSFPLTALESMKSRLCRPYGRQAFTDCKQRFPNLEFISIDLDASKVTPEFAQSLIDADVRKIDLQLIAYLCTQEVFSGQFDGNSRIKFIDLFKEKIDEIKFYLWDNENTMPIRQAVALCRNLKSLRCIRPPGVPNVAFVNEKQLRAMNSELAPLFSDADRASKLENLELIGPIDHEILTDLFKNCVNLKSLSLENCPELFDDHLIAWATRGARPIEFRLIKCKSITDYGVIPILINSGDRLKSFVVGSVRDRTWKCLIENCGYVEESNMPWIFLEQYRRKGLSDKVRPAFLCWRSGYSNSFS